MGPISLSFAWAVCICLGICMAAGIMRTGALQLFGAAAFVFVMFWISRAVSGVTSPPWSLAHYPLQDVTMIGLIWLTWGRRAELWKVATSWLLMLQLVFHAGYWLAVVTGRADHGMLWTYILLNNLGMAGILLVLTMKGVGHVLVGVADLYLGAPLPWAGSVDHHSRPAR